MKHLEPNERAEDKYFVQLEQLEAVIIGFYHDNPELTDYNVDKILNNLIRAIERNKDSRKGLKPLEADLHDRLLWISNKLRTGDYKTFDGSKSFALSDEELVVCYQRLRKSIRVWDTYGRQGYLNQITNTAGVALVPRYRQFDFSDMANQLENHDA